MGNRLVAIVFWIAAFCSAAVHADELSWKGPKEIEIPQEVRVEHDIPYLGSGRKETADLYTPATRKPGERTAAVLLIHGGGFNDGDKRRGREVQMAVELVRHGYLCLSINYKLWNKGLRKPTWPQSLHDAKTAVRWLRVNADKHGIDPDRIAVFGNSAGGNLALMLATTTPEDGLDPAEPYAGVSCRVSCAIDFYGALDLPNYHDMKMFLKSREEAPEEYRRASPINYVKAGNSPMLIVHGTKDETVPVSQATSMADTLKKANVEHQVELVPEAPHTFYLMSPAKDFRPLVFAFLDKHLQTSRKE